MPFDLVTAQPVTQQPSSGINGADRPKFGRPDIQDFIAPNYDIGPNDTPDMIRKNGTKKGYGYLGNLSVADGIVATEISTKANINGKTIDIPTLVPTLTRDEVRQMLSLKRGDPIPQSVRQKAEAHAAERLAKGMDVYATADESPDKRSPWQEPKVGSTSPQVAQSNGKFDLSTAVPIDQSPGAQQEPSLLDSATRGAGLAARDVISGLASLPTAVADLAAYPVNAISRATGNGDLIPSYQQTFQQGLTELGLPSPENNAEQLVSAVGRGAVSAAGGVGVGQLLQQSPGMAARGVGDILTAAPGTQAIAGGSAGAGAELTRQADYGPEAQTLAGLAGGLAGGLSARNLESAAATPLPRGAQTTARGAESLRQAAADAEVIAQRGAQSIGLDWGALDDNLKSVFTKNAEDALHMGSDLPPEAIARKALYESVGIKPTRALITRSFGDALKEQNLLTEPEGQALRNVYIENNQAIRNQIQQLTPEGATAVDQPTFGAQFREPIATGERAAQAASNEAYTAAQAAEGGKNADISRINSFLQENAGTLDNRPASAGLTSDLKKMGLMRNEATSPEMNPASPQFTLQKLASARAAVNEAWQTAKAGGDQRAVGRLNELRNILDETEANAGGELYKAYRQIRTAKGGAYENNPLIDKLLSDQKGYVGTAKIEDSQVFDTAVLNSSTEQFGKTWPLLTSKAKDLTRAQLGKYIEDKAFSNMGMNESGDVVASAAKLSRAIDNINPQKLELIYGKDKAAQLNRLNQAVKEISNPPRGTVPTGSAPKLTTLYRNTVKLLGIAGKVPGLNVVVDVAEKRAASAANRADVESAINPVPLRQNNTAAQPLLERLQSVSPLLLPISNASYR